MVSEEAVLRALRGIRDPEQQQDIVTLGLIHDLQIADSEVSFTLAFTTQSPQAKVTMHSMASRLVSQVPGVSRVQVKMGGRPSQPPPRPPDPGPRPVTGQGPRPQPARIPAGRLPSPP